MTTIGYGDVYPITPEGRLAAMVLMLLGIALFGLITGTLTFAPAAELLSTCLRRTAGRDPELLKEIRYNRAEAYELLGESRKAKSDWAKLVAEDPFYRDARTRLDARPVGRGDGMADN